jgi:hypothetical protein
MHSHGTDNTDLCNILHRGRINVANFLKNKKKHKEAFFFTVGVFCALSLLAFFYEAYTVWNEILAARFLKGKFNCQGGSIYTQNVVLAA